MRYKVVYAFLMVLPSIVVGFSHHHAGNPGYYQYSYGVNDPHTKDHKHQHEEKNGNVVKGSYSLDEPDGTKRVVDYVAGPHKGFQAVVKKIGTAYHPVTYGKSNTKYYDHKGNSGYPSYYGKYNTKDYNHQGKYDPKNYDHYGKYNPKKTHGKHNGGTHTGNSQNPGNYGKFNSKYDNHGNYYGYGNTGSSLYPGYYDHNKGVQSGYKVTQPGKNVKPGLSADFHLPGYYYHPGYGKYIPYNPGYNDQHGGHHNGYGGSNNHNNAESHAGGHGNHKGATSYVGTTYWGY